MFTKQQNKMLAGKQDRNGMPVHETGRRRTEMEESKELLALLREIREHEAEQKRYARKQFYMSFSLIQYWHWYRPPIYPSFHTCAPH